MNHSEELLIEADRCVKCGICLPHCPTYGLTQDEGDSPRGRISLIQALASGSLDSQRAYRHLDRCLTCLACESACPSGVKYGHLIDGIRSSQTKSRRQRLAHRLITHLPYQPWTRLALELYRFGGIRLLMRAIGGKRLRRLDNLLPKNARVGSWNRQYHPTAPYQGRVGLFTGCTGRISDRPALDAAITVLTRLGFEVIIPTGQGCCGAMHQHSGDPQTAQKMAATNHQAFHLNPLDAIVYLASGCGRQLVKQPFEAPVIEISQFLLQCHWPERVQLSPLPYTVGLHTPCSLRHPLQLADKPAQLLRRIPSMRLIRLNGMNCCGAAGSYLLEQPLMADALRRKALDQILTEALDFLATSNGGCALHLASGVREAGVRIKTVHPIELIRLSLDAAQ